MRRRTLLARAVGSLLPAAEPVSRTIYIAPGVYTLRHAVLLRVGDVVHFECRMKWAASAVARGNTLLVGS